MKRASDHSQNVFFRADRFHRSGGYWSFLTQEGMDVGPFESKALAEAELANYLGMETTPASDN